MSTTNTIIADNKGKGTPGIVHTFIFWTRRPDEVEDVVACESIEGLIDECKRIENCTTRCMQEELEESYIEIMKQRPTCLLRSDKWHGYLYQVLVGYTVEEGAKFIRDFMQINWEHESRGYNC
jgi:hypothetical protein